MKLLDFSKLRQYQKYFKVAYYSHYEHIPSITVRMLVYLQLGIFAFILFIGWTQGTLGPYERFYTN